MSGMQLAQTGAGGVAYVDSSSSSVGAVALVLHFVVARGPTNTVQVGTLPANARITAVDVIAPVVSNATTTATVSFGINGGSNTSLSAAQDVKTAIGKFGQTVTAAWAILPASQVVTCTYTETGTASTAGTIYGSITYCVN